MFRLPLLFLTFLIVCLTLEAAQPLRLTPEEAAAYALKHQPSLAAARLRIAEARGRYVQSGRLANPETELGYSHDTRKPEYALELGVTQKFPVTARLRLERAVSQAELAAAEAEVRNEERKVVAEVRGTMVRALALRDQDALRRKQLENARSLVAFIRPRVETGETSSVDMAQAELEGQLVETELLSLAAERGLLLAELSAALGLPSGHTVVPSGELAVPRQADRERTLTGPRADLAAARFATEAARRGIDLARARRWDDLGVGLQFSTGRREDAPEGFENETSVGVRFSMAWPLWDSGAGRVQESTAAAARWQWQSRALEQTITAERDGSRAAMAALAQAITLLDEQLIPRAQRTEAQLRDAYTAGLSPLVDVLRARDRRLVFERQRVDALRDYHLARIRLHSASTSLPAALPFTRPSR